MNALTLSHHLPISPAGDVEGYMQTIRRIPVLDVEDERALALRLKENNDLDAARQLVLSHLRFVAHIARGYSGYGLPQADLIQEGNIGLMKAVKRYDPAHGVRLVSFAVHWIRAEIHEYILRNWRIVRIATTKAQRKLFFNLRSAKQRLGWFSEDEAEAVAKDLGVEARVLRDMESRMALPDLGFDTPLGGESEDEGTAPADWIADSSNDPAYLVAEEDAEQNQQERLLDALNGLNERARDILQRRWLQEPKATLQELADEYGVSAERIRQLESNAMKKLRGALAA
jgi:RNA polymerase sigma-32 factor